MQINWAYQKSNTSDDISNILSNLPGHKLKIKKKGIFQINFQNQTPMLISQGIIWDKCILEDLALVK